MKSFHLVFFDPSFLALWLIALGALFWGGIYALSFRRAYLGNWIEVPLWVTTGFVGYGVVYAFFLVPEPQGDGLLQHGILWGMRAWWVVDCVLLGLSLRRSNREAPPPFLFRQYAVFVALAMVFMWCLFFWSFSASSDIQTVESIAKQGIITAYILNIVLSLSFIEQYFRLRTIRVFSGAVAWLKLLGTAMMTVAVMVSFPVNDVLIVLGITVFFTDVTYLVFLIRISKTSHTTMLTVNDFAFPPNPQFDKLWLENPDYLDFRGLRLRKLQMPHWGVHLEGFIYEVFVVEGAMAYTEPRGDITPEIFVMMTRANENVKKEMGWKDEYFVNNTLYSGKVDRETSRKSHQILLSRWEQGEKVHVYLIASELVRIGFPITRKALPHIYSTWRVFRDFDAALTAMLKTYFRAIPATQVQAVRAPEQTMSYHEERIDQMYAILGKIEAGDLADIPLPEVPSGDMYADIFRALEIVMDDKKMQLARAHEQALELERQSTEIQLVNTTLAQQNQELKALNDEKTALIEQAHTQALELERQAREIQLVNTTLAQQNQELTALNHEKTELMGIVSHDLKNPIGAVRSFAELMQHSLVDEEVMKDTARKIAQTSERMLDLVKNLLDINRLEQGGVQLHMVQLCLASIVESMVWQYDATAQAKNIIVLYKPDGNLYHVLADEQAIMQVIDNLISNALKYSPFDTTITIRVNAHNDTVRLEVEDEGPGISEEEMPKLFGKFSRLSAQPTGGEHSTGLGLSIVKKMVEAMNGKVWCESEPGKGATFIVELSWIAD